MPSRAPTNRKKALTKLAAYVDHVGGQVAAAKLLECSNSYISRILSGDRNVDDVTLAVRIQRACDIPVEWWVNPGVYLLEGIATCAECHAPMRIFSCTARGYSYTYYACERVRHARLYGKERCHAKMQRVDRVDERVWNAVKAWLAKPDLVAQYLVERGDEVGEEAKTALADLRDWQTKLEAIPALEGEALKLREKGFLSPTALETRLGELGRRREALERQMVAAQAAASGARLEAADVAALERTLKELRGRCADASPEQRRDLVRSLCPDGWEISPTTVEGEAVFGSAVGGGTATTIAGQYGCAIAVRLMA